MIFVSFSSTKNNGTVAESYLVGYYLVSYRTPLMLSVMNGHYAVAQLLVEHGAQVDCPDKMLYTALHAAVSCITENCTEHCTVNNTIQVSH